MNKGKDICKTLKGVRLKIAQANDIDYQPAECHHEGDCAGTCPKCESEMRYIERQIGLRRKAGKAVVIAGLSMGLSAITGCHFFSRTAGAVERHNPTTHVDGGDIQLQGDVPYENTLSPEEREKFLKEQESRQQQEQAQQQSQQKQNAENCKK